MSLLALVACGGVTGTTSDTGTLPADTGEGVLFEVAQAVLSDCDPGHFEDLADADPEEVRDSLLELDAWFKKTAWTVGTTTGHENPVEYRSEALADWQFDYVLHVPEAYEADADAPLPLYVDPAHPLDDPGDSYGVLEWDADLAAEPMLVLQANFFNTLYTELGEDAYYEQVVGEDEFGQVVGYQDNLDTIGAAIRDVRRSYWVDSAHVMTGGVSAEGNSAWMQGVFSSDDYAAVLPTSAGCNGYDEDFWRNLEHVAALVVHGTDDTIVDVSQADACVERLESWDHDVEYWRMEGEGHGTMFSSVFGDATAWMLERTREVTPDHVHKAIWSERDADAYWLGVTEFSGSVAEDTSIYAAPAASIDATWSEGRVEVEATGVAAFELRWLDPALGGTDVEVVVNGEPAGTHALAQDPTVAVEEYCRSADLDRLWWGRAVVEVP